MPVDIRFAVAAGALGLLLGMKMARRAESEPAPCPDIAKVVTCNVKHPPVSEADGEGVAEGAFDHSSWTALLQKHVSAGVLRGCKTNVVDYDALGNDPAYERYIGLIAQAVGVDEWAADQQLAFYINSYNALCANHVVRYRKVVRGGAPLQTLEDIHARLCRSGGGAAGTAEAEAKAEAEAAACIWKMHAGVVAGQRCSLDDIEHTLIRGRCVRVNSQCEASLSSSLVQAPGL
jgi:hypothetical protein